MTSTERNAHVAARILKSNLYENDSENWISYGRNKKGIRNERRSIDQVFTACT